MAINRGMGIIAMENVREFPFWIYSNPLDLLDRTAEPYATYVSDRAKTYGQMVWPEQALETAVETASNIYVNRHKLMFYADDDNYATEPFEGSRATVLFDHPLLHTPEGTPENLTRAIVARKPLYNIQHVLDFVQRKHIYVHKREVHLGGTTFARMELRGLIDKRRQIVSILDTVSHLLKEENMRVVHHLCVLLIYEEVWCQNVRESVKPLTRQVAYWSMAIRDRDESKFTVSYLRIAIRVLLYCCRVSTNQNASELIEKLREHPIYGSISLVRRQMVEILIKNFNLNYVIAHPFRAIFRPVAFDPIAGVENRREEPEGEEIEVEMLFEPSASTSATPALDMCPGGHPEAAHCIQTCVPPRVTRVPRMAAITPKMRHKSPVKDNENLNESSSSDKDEDEN